MDRRLLDSLRKGGYILYVRHGEATLGEDQPNLDFQHCFTQKNLSKEGRRQAVSYGESLRKLGIPIGYPIQTSPFCRTIETAQLAFGYTGIQIDPFWVEVYNLSGNLSAQEQQRILDAMQSKLEIKPPPGTNQVIVAHGFPSGVGLGPIPNLGTVVIRPRGQGNGYEVVTRLTPEDLVNP